MRFLPLFLLVVVAGGLLPSAGAWAGEATAPDAPAFASPLDRFLWENRASGLEQCATNEVSTNDPATGFTTEKQWWICLRHAEVELHASTRTLFHSPAFRDLENPQAMHFDLDQEALVAGLFNRFMEWESAAGKTNAGSFQKEIGRRPLNRSTSSLIRQITGGACIYQFVWMDGKATLLMSDAAPYAGNFGKDDVVQFQKLLAGLPEMKEKLVAAIRKKTAENDGSK